jgi:hypothetical protein
MKFINLCHYTSDLDKVATLRPAHRRYIDELDQKGKLWAAGPFANGLGALFVYEAETFHEAEDIFRNDPYLLGEVIDNHELTAWDAALYYAPRVRYRSAGVPKVTE